MNKHTLAGMFTKEHISNERQSVFHCHCVTCHISLLSLFQKHVYSMVFDCHGNIPTPTQATLCTFHHANRVIVLIAKQSFLFTFSYWGKDISLLSLQCNILIGCVLFNLKYPKTHGAKLSGVYQVLYRIRMIVNILALKLVVDIIIIFKMLFILSLKAESIFFAGNA